MQFKSINEATEPKKLNVSRRKKQDFIKFKTNIQQRRINENQMKIQKIENAYCTTSIIFMPKKKKTVLYKRYI